MTHLPTPYHIRFGAGTMTDYRDLKYIESTKKSV
jgi:hypothetical protein